MPFDAFEKNYVTGDLFTRAGRQKAKGKNTKTHHKEEGN